MRTVVLGRRSPHAADVKDWFDRKHLGLTYVVDAGMLGDACRTVTAFDPNAVVLAGRDADTLAIEVCHDLRSTAALRLVPLTVAVECASERERVALLDAGADFVVHPFDVHDIERSVHRSSPRMGLLGPYDGGRLSMVPVGPVVRVMGKPVRLTDLENLLLRVLVHNRHRTLTRSYIEHRIWGAPRSRTLDVHICKLRQKLGAAACDIRSIKGVGYRFIESPSSATPSTGLHPTKGAA